MSSSASEEKARQRRLRNVTRQVIQKVKDDSGSDEDNIPFSEIQAMKAKKKTEIPQLATGEACVGNLI